MSTDNISIFQDPCVVDNLSTLHDKYVVVPADKASNNIIFVCKKYYIDCLISELGPNNISGNPTYTATTLSKEEVITNHVSVLTSFGLQIDEVDSELPRIYWIPKLHKVPYKQRYIAGSFKCTTKPLSKLLTTILTAVKDGLQSYCDVAFSRSGINQMWILKNSKELLETFQSQNLSVISNIKTFDFSTLYTTIPHNKLKSRLKDLVNNVFHHKNGKRRFQYLVVNRNRTYFVINHSDCTTKYTEDDITCMIDFLIDNIFVDFGGRIFQQTIGIPMGTNCAPLLADLFLYSYEAEFIQNLIKDGKRALASKFNLTFRYIDDVLSLNNSQFSDHLHRIYPPELEIKDTTDSTHSASYLDLHLEFDNNGKLATRIYDKRDDFDFKVVNFPYLCSNIPSSPAYGVYISQLIRYSRACSDYHDFLQRCVVLTEKLLKQGYVRPRLVKAFKKFYGRHHDLVKRYNVSVCQITDDIFASMSIGDVFTF